MRRALVFAITTIALVLAWWTAVPTSLGGRTTYVTTHGISMQPRFHTGDLAILHRAKAYRVGEVVAYRSTTLQTVVMHRLIAGDEADGFTVRGDNNSWNDPDHPRHGDILGALSLRIPHGGAALAAAHSPRVYLPGGLAVAGVVAAGTTGGRRRRRRRTQQPPAARQEAKRSAWSDAAVRGSAALTAALLLTAAWLWAQPTTATESSAVSAAQHGRFTYSATAPRTVAYPSGGVRTGDPIYPRLVHRLDIGYIYSDELATSGTLRLYARLSAPSGWSDDVAVASSAVRGGGARITVEVDLDAALVRLGRLAAETGTPAGTGTLSVVATVDGTGRLQGRVTPVRSSGTVAWTTTSSSLTLTNASHLRTDTTTRIAVPRLSPRTMRVLGRAFSVRFLRELTSAALVLAALWFLASYALTRRRTSPHEQAVRRYGERIVEVTHLPLDGTTAVVDVASLAGLHSIAVRYDAAVLHTTYAGQDYYAVRDGETWFCYRTAAVAAQPRLAVVARSA